MFFLIVFCSKTCLYFVQNLFVCLLQEGKFGETQLVTIRNYGYDKSDVKAVVQTLE